MKILNLQFRNINSLKGDWEIRFNDMALGESGLFAITGPVGAGKTSILDALTLALFGKTSRIAESDITEVMTKNASDCYAQVEFAINGSHYRSRWGLRRRSEADGGELLPPFMELAELNDGESLLSNGRPSVIQRIMELTGLDYQKFSRTVLLAQNEFATFLTAKESERFELFEKITGSELYARIAETAAASFRQEQEQIAALTERMGQITLISAEAFNQVKAEIEERSQACRELAAREGALREAAKSLEDKVRSENQQQEAAQQLKDEQQRHQMVKTEAARLETVKQAYILKTEADRVNVRKQSAQEATRIYEAIKAELESAEKEFSEQEQVFKATQAELEEMRQNRGAYEKQAEKTLILDRQIKTDEKCLAATLAQASSLKQDYVNLMRTRTDTEKNLKENQETQLDASKKLTKCLKDRPLTEDIPKLRELLLQFAEARSKRELAAKLKSKLKVTIDSAEHDLKKTRAHREKLQLKSGNLAARKDDIEISLGTLAGNVSPDEFDRKYQAGAMREGLFKDLLRIAQAYAEHREERDQVQKAHDTVGKSLALLLKQRTDYLKEFNTERTRSVEIKKIVAWQTTIESFDKIRHELKEGCSCPVCGAEDHPFVKQGLPKLGEPVKELELRQRNIRVTQKQIDKLEKNKSKIQSRYGTLRRRLVELDEKLAGLSADWEQTSRQTGEALSISSIEMLQAKLKTIQMDNRRNKGAIAEIYRLRKKHNQIKMKWNKVKERPLQMAEEISRLSTLLQHKIKELGIIEKELMTVADKEQNLRGDIQRLLTPYNEKIPEKDDERNLLNNLEDRLKTLHYYEERVESLSARQGELAEKLALVEEKGKLIQQEITVLDAQVKNAGEIIANAKQRRAENYGDLNPLAEIKKLRQAEEAAREKHRHALLEYNRLHKKLATKRDLTQIRRIEAEKVSAEAVNLERAFLEKMKTAGFDTPETLKQVTITHAEIKQIEEKLTEATSRVKRAEYRLDAISRNLATLAQQCASLPSREDAMSDLASLKLQKERHEAEIMERKKQLKQQAELAEEKRRLIAEIEQRDKERVRWSLLNTLSRAPEGYEFRKAAQSFTLDSLLNISNRYLTRINGRYTLVKHQNQLLGLEIADVYQQGVRRPLTTLSGGERFLVSFSLAVGLSELTAEHSQVKSLFLDENFGVLDEESLQVILSSMMKLRSGGRQIGIVTHLDYLRNRIHPHIRLEKRLDEPGTSRIIHP